MCVCVCVCVCVCDEQNAKDNFICFFLNRTLYCAKGNYEFGISRIMKSLEPYNKKVGIWSRVGALKSTVHTLHTHKDDQGVLSTSPHCMSSQTVQQKHSLIEEFRVKNLQTNINETSRIHQSRGKCSLHNNPTVPCYP